MQGTKYNIRPIMKDREYSYEVIVSKQEYDRLHADMEALKETNNLLNEDNRMLSTKVYELSANLSKSVREGQNIAQMEMKVRALSKTVLQLSRMIMKLTENHISADQEENKNEQVVNQLVKRVQQLQSEKTQWQTQRTSMEKEYLLLLEAKQKIIEDIQSELKALKDAIYISQKREQNKIIKQWKLKPEYVNAVRQMAINQQERQKNELNKIIETLKRQKDELNTLVINERAIVDFLRQKVAEKDTHIKQLKNRSLQNQEEKIANFQKDQEQHGG